MTQPSNIEEDTSSDGDSGSSSSSSSSSSDDEEEGIRRSMSSSLSSASETDNDAIPVPSVPTEEEEKEELIATATATPSDSFQDEESLASKKSQVEDEESSSASSKIARERRRVARKRKRRRMYTGAMVGALILLSLGALGTLFLYNSRAGDGSDDADSDMDFMLRETSSSIIKAGPIEGTLSFSAGAILISYTTLVEDSDTIFYYVSTRNLSISDLLGDVDKADGESTRRVLEDSASIVAAEGSDSIALFLTPQENPDILNTSSSLQVPQGWIDEPQKLPGGDSFLPGDYRGFLILAQDPQGGDAVVASGTFSIIVNPGYNIASPTSQPSASPSNEPSLSPSTTPSGIPSFIPSDMPSTIPSENPSSVPSMRQSSAPSMSVNGTKSNNTLIPSISGSSAAPSSILSGNATLIPSQAPSNSLVPTTASPTNAGTSHNDNIFNHTVSNHNPDDSNPVILAEQNKIESDMPSWIPSSIPPSSFTSWQPSLLPSGTPSMTRTPTETSPVPSKESHSSATPTNVENQHLLDINKTTVLIDPVLLDEKTKNRMVIPPSD